MIGTGSKHPDLCMKCTAMTACSKDDDDVWAPVFNRRISQNMNRHEGTSKTNFPIEFFQMKRNHSKFNLQTDVVCCLYLKYICGMKSKTCVKDAEVSFFRISHSEFTGQFKSQHADQADQLIRDLESREHERLKESFCSIARLHLQRRPRPSGVLSAPLKQAK